jgi:murein DD-endopeptidase MepM/ murein hydrolase activator NlpD
MGAPSGQIDVYPARRGPLPDGPGVVYGWQVTSYFGGRIDPLTGRVGRHGGEDQAYYRCEGSPIIAPIGGLLSQGWDSSGGGNWSGLTGHNGDYWGFGHAVRFEWTGGGTRWVEAGQVIAYTGTTGGSTGPHNHIAYRPRGASGYRDPHDILVAAANAGAPPEGDWSDMASKEEIEEVVRKVVQDEILNQDKRTVAVLGAIEKRDADQHEKTRVYLGENGQHKVTREFIAGQIKDAG